MKIRLLGILLLVVSLGAMACIGIVNAANEDASNQQLVGSGDFNGDGYDDFVVRGIGNQVSLGFEIWYMQHNLNARTIIHKQAIRYWFDNTDPVAGTDYAWNITPTGTAWSMPQFECDDIFGPNSNATVYYGLNATTDITESNATNSTGIPSAANATGAYTSVPDILFQNLGNGATGYWVMGGINGSQIMRWERLQAPN